MSKTAWSHGEHFFKPENDSQSTRNVITSKFSPKTYNINA